MQQAVPEQLLEAQKGSKPFPKLPNSNSKPFPKNQSLRTAFPQFSKALDQERLHFTLVGLFAGFTIAASCARAAPGSPEEKQAFSKGNCQIQIPSLSQRSQSLQQAVPEQLLEAQKRSKPFPKAIAKFQLQAFPKGANPLLNPY